MTSSRLRFDGFSLVLPAGWSEMLDEATYTDPEQSPPLVLVADNGAGTLYVSTPVLYEDTFVGMTTEDAERRALEWGRRRGLPEPVLLQSEPLPDGGARATAVHRVGEQLVQVWFLTNGRDVVHASYVSSWDERDHDRRGREAIVASLRLD